MIVIYFSFSQITNTIMQEFIPLLKELSWVPFLLSQFVDIFYPYKASQYVERKRKRPFILSIKRNHHKVIPLSCVLSRFCKIFFARYLLHSDDKQDNLKIHFNPYFRRNRPWQKWVTMGIFSFSFYLCR